jgi:adenine-specific DNA glycosylase
MRTDAVIPNPIPRDRAKRISARVEDWFTANARTFPWRTSPRDPWMSYLSEILAQQTQISRVAERIPALFSTYPTPTRETSTKVRR